MSYHLVSNGFHLEFQHETRWFQILLCVQFKHLSAELAVIFVSLSKLSKEHMQSCIREKITKFHKMFVLCFSLRLD